MTLRDRIKLEEGFRAEPYPDPITGGKPFTFGWGFTRIGLSAAEVQLGEEIGRATDIARRFSGEDAWNAMGRVRQEVLIEMAYNSGLWVFRRLRRAIEECDWGAAGHEIRDSKAWRDFQRLGNPRWERFARWMESGSEDDTGV